MVNSAGWIIVEFTELLLHVICDTVAFGLRLALHSVELASVLITLFIRQSWQAGSVYVMHAVHLLCLFTADFGEYFDSLIFFSSKTRLMEAWIDLKVGLTVEVWLGLLHVFFSQVYVGLVYNGLFLIIANCNDEWTTAGNLLDILPLKRKDWVWV